MTEPRITFDIPVRTVSEANRASHEHWRVRHKRAKGQREASWLTTLGPTCVMRAVWEGSGVAPVRIHLTRHAPGTLDSDNLAGSMKHVRDGIADALGIDDGDPRLEWTYAQERTRRGCYFVRVEIRPKEARAA